MYLPVPIWGFLCDRFSPRPIQLLAGLLFAFGYVLAAFTYRSGPPDSHGWPYGVMILAFVGIGLGTSSMYLSAVTACVKNFGRGKHKGLTLAVPIAAFGLSGMWQSQIASQLLYEESSSGVKGDIDVFLFFLFLGITLCSIGIIGTFLLQVVDDEEIIDEAVNELERSGFLEESPFFEPLNSHDSGRSQGYGTVSPTRHPEEPLSQSLASLSNVDKKTWLLNGETRRFLTDHSMWLLAIGFFLVIGPVETFINNLGTMIGTLYRPPSMIPPSNAPSIHVSILAITSTFARLVAGLLSDLLAPSSDSSYKYHHLSSSIATSPKSSKKFTLSRMTLLLISTIALGFGFVLLASPVISKNPDLFPLVSGVVGITNGAAFALVPIIISVVWGVQNFGTNWGIVAMMPAAGATVWSAVYSVAYERGVKEGDEGLCYGSRCFAPTAAGMAGAVFLATALWTWAWRGRAGWLQRGAEV